MNIVLDYTIIGFESPEEYFQKRFLKITKRPKVFLQLKISKRSKIILKNLLMALIYDVILKHVLYFYRLSDDFLWDAAFFIMIFQSIIARSRFDIGKS